MSPDLASLLLRWRALADEYDRQADQLSRRGNLYAATRLEGQADAVRVCAEELVKNLGEKK